MKYQYATGVVALVLSLGAVVVQAQDYDYLPPGAGPIFHMGIGPSFFEDGELTQFGGPVSSPVQYQTGVAVDTAFGWAFNRYVALDFDTGFVDAKIDNVSGYASDNSYLYNVPFLLDVTLSCPIPHTNLIPYAGAGAGGADVIFDTDSFTDGSTVVTGSENDVVFAGQVFAGLRFRLSRNFSLDLGYKYFATGAPTFSYPPSPNFDVGFRGARTHSILFTLLWTF
jgi:opacity protein-like surface antigen